MIPIARLALALTVASAIVGVNTGTAQGKQMKEIRTYMPFSFPVDPVKIQITPDMDLSYALASTLVEWSQSKQISAGLAERWSSPTEKAVLFHLRSGIRWSDGTPLTSQDVKRSFERAFKAHPEDLRSLTNLLGGIDSPSAGEVLFSLKGPAQPSDLLRKLTEANYGVLNIGKDGKPDLSRTSGAFFLEKESQAELTLLANKNWVHFDGRTADQVLIRRTPVPTDSTVVLLKDNWPNLVETSSLIPAETLKQYRESGYAVWQRPLDKVFLLQLVSKNATDDRFAMLRFLNSKLDRARVTQGLSGQQAAVQVFPKGYELHDATFAVGSQNYDLPEVFKKRPLKILMAQGRVLPALQRNIKAALKELTGQEPSILEVPFQEAMKARAAGEYDFYAGIVGLADPDPEGMMSFYFEGEASVVPSSRENNFLGRLDQARKEPSKNKIPLMRGILSDAVKAGHVLPLFHASTIGIGRKDLDFSEVPTSDESITLSRVRFKEAP